MRKVRIYLHQEPYIKEGGKYFPKLAFAYFSVGNNHACILFLKTIVNLYYHYRDDGIVISISIWQCLVEFCTNFLIIGCLFIFKEHTYNLLEFLLLITCCLNYVIFPSFYLLADFRFRNTFYQRGSFQAVWSALKQNYEKNSNELEMQVMS